MGRKALDVGPLSLAVATIMREHQDAAGVSDYTLADLSGIPRERLRRSLNGDRPFLIDDFEAAASALGLVAWQVMREAEQSLQSSEVVEMTRAT